MAPPIHWMDRVASTQDELHRLAAAGAPAGTAVAAREQTAGRGARGSRWASGPGGAWVSVLLRPAAPAEPLSLRVGLRVAAAVEALAGVATRLKWPNDLMVGERKVGGILCEARWQGDAPAWVAAGVGINVRNAPPEDARLAAAALAEWQPALAPEAVVAAVVGALAPGVSAAARLDPAELGAFAARDWLAGRRLVGPVPGLAAGVAPDGALQVRRDDGSIALVQAGPVVPASPTHAGS